MDGSQGGQGHGPSGAKASPVRLVVLLAILAVMVGAYGFDAFVAQPGAEKAHEKLEAEAMKRNSMGLDLKLSEAERKKLLAETILDDKAVRKILNKTPAKVETHNERAGDEYTIEYYQYWGYLPLNRHFISVVYRGKAPSLRYNAHFRNIRPPEDQLPGFQRSIAGYDTPAGANEPMKMGGGDMGGMAGGKGKGKGGGKGKGKGDQPPAEVTPPAESTPVAEGAPVTEAPGDAPKGSAAKDGEKPETKADEAPAEKKDGEPKKDDSDTTDEKKADEKQPDEEKKPE